MLTERYFSSIFFAFIFLSAFLPKVGATLSSFNPPDDREERLHRQLQSMQRGQTVRNVQLTRTGEFWAKASVDIRENFNITNNFVIFFWFAKFI